MVRSNDKEIETPNYTRQIPKSKFSYQNPKSQPFSRFPSSRRGEGWGEKCSSEIGTWSRLDGIGIWNFKE
jgi:hypothetical protein